jgi:hypothetical protein
MYLRAAGQSQTVSTILKVLSYVMLGVGLPGLLLTGLVLLILMPGPWVSGIALTFAIIPVLLWLFLRGRGKATLLDRDRALESAYSQAILGVLRASPLERDAATVAHAIALDLDHTERLLSKLNADERMTSRVTDDGDLVFGVAEPARVRVADDAQPASQAIIEAELDEQSAVDPSLRNRT